MLVADDDGIVCGSLPIIAQRNMITVEECSEIIERWMNPDEHSVSRDHEGRRVEKVERGWRLLNFEKFRRLFSEKERADHRRRYRTNWQAAREVSDQITMFSDSEVVQGTKVSGLSRPATHSEMDVAEAILRQYVAGRRVSRTKSLPAIIKACRKSAAAHVLSKTQAYAKTCNKPVQFIPLSTTFFKEERFNDDPSTWVDHNIPKINGRPGSTTDVKAPMGLRKKEG